RLSRLIPRSQQACLGASPASCLGISDDYVGAPLGAPEISIPGKEHSMGRLPASLLQQRKMLESLGFGFLEEAWDGQGLEQAGAASVEPAARTSAPPALPVRTVQVPPPQAAPPLQGEAPLSSPERVAALATFAQAVSACQRCD